LGGCGPTSPRGSWRAAWSRGRRGCCRRPCRGVAAAGTCRLAARSTRPPVALDGAKRGSALTSASATWRCCPMVVGSLTRTVAGRAARAAAAQPPARPPHGPDRRRRHQTGAVHWLAGGRTAARPRAHQGRQHPPRRAAPPHQHAGRQLPDRGGATPQRRRRAEEPPARAAAGRRRLWGGASSATSPRWRAARSSRRTRSFRRAGCPDHRPHR
jgi:hypothetical protein